MKRIYLWQLSVTLLGGALLLWLSNWRAASSYVAGSFLILVNIALMAWLWGRLLEKKLVALSLFIIVFKYAILGTILYQLLKSSWMHPAWFCVGISTLMFTAVGAVLGSSTPVEETP